jgi:hypothetical protein
MKKKVFSSIFVLVVVLSIVTTAFAATNGLPGTGWWSVEQIQNVSASTAGLTLTAYDSLSSATYQATYNLPSGLSKNFSPSDFAGMPAGFQGSMVVSSSADIRAIVTVTTRVSGSLGDPLSPSPAAGLYQGVIIPSSTINFPQAKNNHYGKTSALAIQNAGSASATVTAVFKFSNAPGIDYTYTSPSLLVGQMVMVNPADARDLSNNPPPSGNGSVAGVTVTSSQPLAGTYLEFNTGEAHATVLHATRAHTTNDYNNTLFAPTNKSNYYNRNTGLVVQNVSGGLVNITATFKAIDQQGGYSGCNTTWVRTANGVAAGASTLFYAPDFMPAGCLASATVVATGNIAALVNEAFPAAFLTPGKYQEATTYFGFPFPSATTVLSLPLYKEDSYSKQSAITIQNVSDFTANVTLKFQNTLGTFTSVPQPIASKAGIVIINVRQKPSTFWVGGVGITPALMGCVESLTACGANGVWAVIVTSDQPVVAIVNESTYPIAAPRFLMDKSNYEAFNLITAP